VNSLNLFLVDFRKLVRSVVGTYR